MTSQTLHYILRIIIFSWWGLFVGVVTREYHVPLAYGVMIAVALPVTYLVGGLSALRLSYKEDPK